MRCPAQTNMLSPKTCTSHAKLRPAGLTCNPDCQIVNTEIADPTGQSERLCVSKARAWRRGIDPDGHFFADKLPLVCTYPPPALRGLFLSAGILARHVPQDPPALLPAARIGKTPFWLAVSILRCWSEQTEDRRVHMHSLWTTLDSHDAQPVVRMRRATARETLVTVRDSDGKISLQDISPLGAVALASFRPNPSVKQLCFV